MIEQSQTIMIHVEARPMQTGPAPNDLDCGNIGRRGRLQSLQVGARDRHADSIAQIKYDAIVPPVISDTSDAWVVWLKRCCGHQCSVDIAVGCTHARFVISHASAPKAQPVLRN